jgi:hypothetical protein
MYLQPLRGSRSVFGISDLSFELPNLKNKPLFLEVHRQRKCPAGELWPERKKTSSSCTHDMIHLHQVEIPKVASMKTVLNRAGEAVIPTIPCSCKMNVRFFALITRGGFFSDEIRISLRGGISLMATGEV